MDSRLAVAQTSSSSVDDQNESKPLDESGPKVLGGQTDKTSASTLATSLQLFPITPVTSRQVSSANGDTSKRASQKPCKSQDGPKQPIIVKTGTPVLNNQPIRIKIIVRGKNPIISTAPTSLTKELCPSEFTKSAPGAPETAPLAGGKTAGETPCPRPPSAITNERPAEEAVRPTAEDTKAGSFDGAEGNGGTERTTEDARDDGDDDADRQQDSSTTTAAAAADPNPISDERLRLNGDTAPPTEDQRPAGESGADREEVTLPLDLHKVDLEVVRGQVEVVEEVEEQTEPLDLSLPRSNRDADGRRREDSGCESSLIMEVDEFEGEGDRDVVEEDDDDDADEDADDGDGADEDREVVRNVTPAYGATHADSFCDSILSPSFFSTSVFASLSSIDSDHDEFLFIDDQGIPYNLSPEGHKVPQIDTSKLDGGPLSGRPVAQPRSNHGQGEEPSQLVTLLASNLGQSLGNPSHAVIAPRDNLLASSQTSVSPPQSAEPSQAAELSTCALATKTPEFSEAAAPCQTSPGETGGVLPGNQTVQILSNPSGNAPILLLSSPSPAPAQFPSSPMGLSLPLSVARSPAPSSTPMLLLLSTVSSSAGPSLALLDPSTGQLSQITAASAGPLSFPALSAGQLGKPGSALLSYPMFQLGASNTSVVLSGVGNNLTTKLVPLTSSSSSSISTITPPTLQTSNLIPSAGALCKGAPPGPSQTGVSDTHVEAEVISKEGNTKPSPTSTSGSPPPLLNYDLTFDTLDPLSPQADPSSGSDPGVMVDPSAVLPDDHLYFSSMGGPPSPSIFTSSQLDAMDPLDPLDSLDPLDPLDPLSPSSSPNSLGPRKILYCQLCPRVFFYSSDLERHAITHSQKKPHVCQQCGKAFKRSSHLQRHKHIHTGQRNYVCPICAKRFREAGELQRHQRVHTGEKPYQCQLCHTRFAERNTLRRHTKRKHPYHQVAMEMLQERRRGAGSGGGRDDDDDGDGGGGGGRGGGPQMQQEDEEEDEEERAEWYSSAVSRLEDAESYMET